MKYYYPEHIEGYQRVQAEGKTAWGEIHGAPGFESFSARSFLAGVLPTLHFDSPEPTVLNYGCGTGPDACFLAERGFRVDAIDLIPTAIDIARQQAAARGLDISYDVQDICALPVNGKQYDLIVDSYCLQCIVLDADRERLFSAVRARLKPSGYYLISTDHLSDRELNLYLWNEILDTEGPVLTPGFHTNCHIDLVGSGSEEDVELWMTYYADEETRAEWARDFPDFPMPPRRDPPYDRDRHLPRPPGE